MRSLSLILLSVLLSANLKAADEPITRIEPPGSHVYRCSPRKEFPAGTRQILFVCSGNYFRSRYAEAYFNCLSDRAGAPFHAISRGVRVGDHDTNVSPLTSYRMAERNIDPAYLYSLSKQIQWEDVDPSAWVIGMNRSEHRSWIYGLFPDQDSELRLREETGLLRFWNVPDASGPVDGDRSLDQIEAQVDQLFKVLQ